RRVLFVVVVVFQHRRRAGVLFVGHLPLQGLVRRLERRQLRADRLGRRWTRRAPRKFRVVQQGLVAVQRRLLRGCRRARRVVVVVLRRVVCSCVVSHRCALLGHRGLVVVGKLL